MQYQMHGRMCAVDMHSSMETNQSLNSTRTYQSPPVADMFYCTPFHTSRNYLWNSVAKCICHIFCICCVVFSFFFFGFRHRHIENFRDFFQKTSSKSASTKTVCQIHYVVEDHYSKTKQKLIITTTPKNHDFSFHYWVARLPCIVSCGGE